LSELSISPDSKNPVKPLHVAGLVTWQARLAKSLGQQNPNHTQQIGLRLMDFQKIGMQILWGAVGAYILSKLAKKFSFLG
jgi:hypothetical protein